MPTLTQDDVGKKVVNRDGEQIGMVSAVDHGHIRVDPDPGLADSIKSRLGWMDTDDDDYLLEESHIETVTDDEVRLSH